MALSLIAPFVLPTHVSSDEWLTVASAAFRRPFVEALAAARQGDAAEIAVGLSRVLRIAIVAERPVGDLLGAMKHVQHLAARGVDGCSEDPVLAIECAARAVAAVEPQTRPRNPRSL